MTKEDREKVIQVFEGMKHGVFPWYSEIYFDTAIEALSVEPCDDCISRLDTSMTMKIMMDNATIGDGDNDYATLDDLKQQYIEIVKGMAPVTPKQETVTEFADRCRECGSMLAKRDNCVLDKVKAEIREWYWQADKQALAKDPCVVDAMIGLFIRTIDKYKEESEDKV